MDGKVPIDTVIEDMCFHEVGWIREAAEAYFHEEYLGEKLVDNPNRKWWQFWKPMRVWKKVR